MSNAAVWWLIAGCAAVTFALKAVGPILTGGRRLPAPAAAVLAMLAPAMVAGLVATHTFVPDRQIELTATAAGVAVAGILLVLRVHALLALLAAVAVTALLRMV